MSDPLAAGRGDDGARGGRRAKELRNAAGWGPTAKLMPVAMAWAELGRVMEEK